jgi:hypothetical protein
MEVEQALGDVVEPVLLVVPKGVDGPQRPGLVLGQLEARKLTGLVDRRLEPDAAARLLVEDLCSPLKERGLRASGPPALPSRRLTSSKGMGVSRLRDTACDEV